LAKEGIIKFKLIAITFNMEKQMRDRWTQRPKDSTWGDWGPDDQLGRLNLLTPERRIMAVREVIDGLTFCLSLPLNLPGGNEVNPKRREPVFGPVFNLGHHYYNFDWEVHKEGLMDITSDEYVILYSQYSTQWDSLAHVGCKYDIYGDGNLVSVYYNGYKAGKDIGGSEGSLEIGARALGIENMAYAGVQGRGVLIDLYRHFGSNRTVVNFGMLMEVLQEDNISIEEGDMILFHTGWDDMILSMNGKPDAIKLHQSCAVLDGFDQSLLDWIQTSGISVIATDNMAVEDSQTHGYAEGGDSRLPLHRQCLFRLGVHLGELWFLSELASALFKRGRSRFLLTAPPLRLPGAVGSPVTPIATI